MTDPVKMVADFVALTPEYHQIARPGALSTSKERRSITFLKSVYRRYIFTSLPLRIFCSRTI